VVYLNNDDRHRRDIHLSAVIQYILKEIEIVALEVLTEDQSL
jgi:hypothetical protein